MRKVSFGLLAATFLLVAGTASADVVIHFTSGKTLPAKAVRYVGDMVEVDLGGDGQISFPRATIERVEEPQRSLNLERNTATNRRTGPMVAGSTERSGERASDVAQIKPPPRRNPGVPVHGDQPEIDKNGLAVITAAPFASSYAATRLKNVVLPDPYAAMNNNTVGGNSLRGTHYAGGKFVMAGDTLPPRPTPVELQPRGAASPPPETPTDNGGGSGDSSSDQ